MTSSAPAATRAGISATYRVRARMKRPGARVRQCRIVCRVARGSETRTIAARAFSIPLRRRTTSLVESPYSIGTSFWMPFLTRTGSRSITRNGSAGALQDPGDGLAHVAEADDEDDAFRDERGLRAAGRRLAGGDTERDGMAGLREKRRRDHGDDRRGEERLVHDVRDQPGSLDLSQEHERELADLRQREADDGGHAEAVAHDQDRYAAGDGLPDQDEGEEDRDEERLLEEHARIEEHPDRDEEDGVEDVPEGRDVRESLVAVLRLGEHEPREEGPERRGQARPRGRERRAQHQEEDGDDEDLLLPGAGERTDESGDHEACDHEQHGGGQDGLSGLEEDRHRPARSAVGEGGYGKQHRNDRQVLKDQDADEGPPVRRVELVAIEEEPENDGRGRKGRPCSRTAGSG